VETLLNEHGASLIIKDFPTASRTWPDLGDLNVTNKQKKETNYLASR
jgi:hypothetical protein